MRKVYHNEKSTGGLAVAVLAAVGITGILFGILPFSHQLANPTRSLELRTTKAVDVPPPVEPDAPPPVPETENPPDAPPPPQLVDAPQQIQVSPDLEVVTGLKGGALPGFGDIRKIAAADAAQDNTFSSEELEKQPEGLSITPPVYPRELARAKVEGLVTLVFLITEEGRVEDPRVENSTRPEFEKPAMEAVRKWKFRPGQKEGQAVRSYMRAPIRFRMPAT